MFNMNGYMWEVIITSPSHPCLRRSNGSYALGSCDNNCKTIYLNEFIPTDKLLKVLCHEITHAAMFSYNVNLSLDQEELVADLIATYGKEITSTADKIFKKISKKWGA